MKHQEKTKEELVIELDELHKAFDALKRSNLQIESEKLKFVELYDFAPSGYFSLSKEGKILQLNLRGAEIIGSDRSELINKSFGFFVSDDTKQEFDVFLTKAFSTKDKESCEVKLLTKDELSIYIHISGIATEDREECHLIVVDITERKHSQKILRESEEKYRKIFESIHDAYYESTIDGTILEISPSIEIISKGQYTRDELIGKSLVAFYENQEDRISFFSEIEKRGSVTDYELSLRNKDGAVLSIAISSTLIYDANGRPYRITGTIRDITDRKNYEREIQNKTTLLSNLIINLQEGILLESANRKILLTNELFCEMFGIQVPAQALIGADCSESAEQSKIYFKNPEKFVADISRILADKVAVFNEELALVDGRHFERDYIPTYSNNEYTGHLWKYRDVTDSKLAEDEIRKLNVSLALTVDERTAQLALTNEHLKLEYEARNKAAEALEEALNTLHKIADRVPGVVYQYRLHPDGSSCFPYASEGIREIYSVSPEDVTKDASTVFSRIHPDDIGAVVETIQLSAKDLTIWNHEYRVKFENGDVRWLSGNAAPQREADGTVLWHGFIKDITERKQTEEQLKQVSARLKLAARAGGVGVWDYDLVGNILVWDAQMFSLYGLQEKDFSGAYEAWQKGLHPDDRQRGDAEIRMAIEGEKEFDTEFRVVRPDGTIRNIRALAIVQRDDAGTPLHMIGTNWDITDEKKVETLLDQTRYNYETFFNTIDDFLFVLDEQGNMIHTNSTVTKRLEYSTPELFGKSVLIVHPAERREEAGRIVGEMLAGTADYCPVPLITRSGNYIPVETRVKTGLWDGNPAIFGVSKDISKIKLSEEKFSKAFQSNSALMAISGLDGRFIDINNSFLNKLGFIREEVVGKSSIELKLFTDSLLRTSILEKLSQNIPVREIEVEVTRKDGSTMIGLFSAETIYIGQELCLLTIMIDITERKLAEAEIINARNEAEKANVAKSEFLSRMSHELRTPMNSILGFAQLMQMGQLNPGQKKGVNHILASGTHLLQLINEVLDISRIEAGRITLSLEPVQLSIIIGEMIDIVHPNTVMRNLKTELVSSPGNQLFVKADIQRLKQVLLNLINNAVKYNREGGSVIIQTVLQEAIPDCIPAVRISVSDMGPGISAEDLGKLFHPFERIGAEKSETEGTGLGLTVVKKLMDAMGGRVGVESIPGEGSTFWIELPLAESQKTLSSRSNETAKTESGITEKAATILYIEDNISNAELVEEILKNQRPAIRLITSVSGKQAVNLAIDYAPDLILLDLDLPDMHGSKVLAKLQANSKTCNIPVVIISADAMPQQVENLMLAGARDYLTKPLEIISFLLMVDEWVGNGNTDK